MKKYKAFILLTAYDTAYKIEYYLNVLIEISFIQCLIRQFELKIIIVLTTT